MSDFGEVGCSRLQGLRFFFLYFDKFEMVFFILMTTIILLFLCDVVGSCGWFSVQVWLNGIYT